MNLGENICVGDVGQSNVNIFHQMLIGAEAAKTTYVIMAEADYLHPREYFEIKPPRDDVMYIAVPLYILSSKRGKRRVFCPKENGSEGAMVTNKQLLVYYLKKMLKRQPEWYNSPGRDVIHLPWLLQMCKHEEITLSKPLVSFRTDKQLHAKTPYKPGNECREIPYWGKAEDLIIKYTGRK